MEGNGGQATADWHHFARFELKDEIENQLIVKKDDRGSHISWR